MNEEQKERVEREREREREREKERANDNRRGIDRAGTLPGQHNERRL